MSTSEERDRYIAELKEYTRARKQEEKEREAEQRQADFEHRKQKADADKEKTNKWLAEHKTLSGLIGLAIVIVFFGAILGTCTAVCSNTDESTIPELNANVFFDGAQFVITNNDTFDWTNVEMELNYEGLKSGYTYNYHLIEAGYTYTVGALQFAKGDGTRFNPFTMKPRKFSIRCDTPAGRSSWYGGWE